MTASHTRSAAIPLGVAFLLVAPLLSTPASAKNELEGFTIHELWLSLPQSVLGVAQSLALDRVLFDAPTRFAADWPRDRPRWIRALAWTGGTDAYPVGRAAIQGGEAESTRSPWAGVHVWAEGAGYSVGRRSAGYGIEGGAALPLGDGIDLALGFRLAGYALGSRLDPELTDVQERVFTPFLGFDFEF